MRAYLIPVMALLLTSAGAEAGQVRIDVGLFDMPTFSPQMVSLNPGDQVYWIWKSGLHSVTQGSHCSATGAIFNSGDRTNYIFSWKSDRSGTFPYFSMPNCMDGVTAITGTLIITSDTYVPTANFRITEISRSNSHTNDYLEITNVSEVAGDFAQFQLADNENQLARFSDTEWTVPPGASFLIRGPGGVNTPTEIHLPLNLFAHGSIAMYVPNSRLDTGDVSLMIDYVQWGAAGRPNEFTAASAGYWTSGQFLPLIGEGQALEFCGGPDEHGMGFWRVTDTPTPGVHTNCGTAVETSTWSQVKTLGR